MPYFSLISIIFGIIIVMNPDLIAYMIGFLFFFLGVNSLIYYIATKRRISSGSQKSWSFGNYEIIKKK
ncbi:hypothetical protein KBC86_01150 [Candidatus Gracilibacteria bacterium]|nr:hypothetical protein [Candidatus Gracilibacteria bacterium]